MSTGLDASERKALMALQLAWEGCVRPALRAHAAHVTENTGRRPLVDELVALFGLAAHLAVLVGAVVDGRRPDAACLVIEREGIAALLWPQLPRNLIDELAEVLRGLPAGHLAVLYVDGDGPTLVSVPVTDTGPEGDRINVPTVARGRPS